MTQNQTIQTIPHPTWTVTAYRHGLTWKVIARNGHRVIHRDKLTDADLATFDPDFEWTGQRKAPHIVDFVAQLDGAA